MVGEARLAAAVLATPFWHRRFGAGHFGAAGWRRTLWRRGLAPDTLAPDNFFFRYKPTQNGTGHNPNRNGS